VLGRLHKGRNTRGAWPADSHETGSVEKMDSPAIEDVHNPT